MKPASRCIEIVDCFLFLLLFLPFFTLPQPALTFHVLLEINFCNSDKERGLELMIPLTTRGLQFYKYSYFELGESTYSPSNYYSTDNVSLKF